MLIKLELVLVSLRSVICGKTTFISCITLYMILTRGICLVDVANLRRHPTATLCGETWRDRQNEPRR